MEIAPTGKVLCWPCGNPTWHFPLWMDPSPARCQKSVTSLPVRPWRLQNSKHSLGASKSDIQCVLTLTLKDKSVDCPRIQEHAMLQAHVTGDNLLSQLLLSEREVNVSPTRVVSPCSLGTQIPAPVKCQLCAYQLPGVLQHLMRQGFLSLLQAPSLDCVIRQPHIPAVSSRSSGHQEGRKAAPLLVPLLPPVTWHFSPLLCRAQCQNRGGGKQPTN